MSKWTITNIYIINHSTLLDSNITEVGKETPRLNLSSKFCAGCRCKRPHLPLISVAGIALLSLREAVGLLRLCEHGTLHWCLDLLALLVADID